MSKLKALTDYIKRGAYNELYTPVEAIEFLVPYIPDEFGVIWECTSDGSPNKNNIVSTLQRHGYSVIATHINNGQSFLEYEPDDYDVVITNPPYKYKDLFLKRAYELGKPFAFLLPLTTLEGVTRNKLFSRYGVQVIIPNKRFNFKPEKGSSAWFQTSWFTWGFGLERDLTFVEVGR